MRGDARWPTIGEMTMVTGKVDGLEDARTIVLTWPN